MFRHLRTKLTVLYAALFAGTLALIAAAVYVAISSNALAVVRGELTASSTVFDRVWALRTAQLENGASLLSRDFGFREAMASNDAATIGSALENLKVRLGIDLAFTIGVDGRVTVAGGRPVAGLDAGTLAALQVDDGASGVVMIGGAPYEAVSAPILSPTQMGWVVFAARLDDREMRSLQRLSAIPLDAQILQRRGAAPWRCAAWIADPKERARIGGFVDAMLRAHSLAPGRLASSRGDAIALAKPLQTLGEGQQAVLLLRYPIARAMAPYRLLLAAVIGMGLFGVALLVIGSWMLARSLTRPISALEEGVRRLQRGETAQVEISTQDEIARLAQSFNQMADSIGERERKIVHLALHDPHSGLPNRHALERGVSELLSSRRKARLGSAAAGSTARDDLYAAALGVDRFAHVRGAIGYAQSDALIGEIGARLSRLHPRLKVARLSSEKLGIIFEAADLAAARAFAGDLQTALEEPLRLGENTIDVSLTIGMAARRANPGPVDLLVERADIAVDQARAARQKIAVFDPEVYGDPSANLSLMSEMRRSILDGDMLLYHQPKYDLRAQAVTGVEALVRWRHPTRGLIPPDRFIGMAEETGHIRALTEWVLAQAIADQRRLSEAGHDLAVSVNISGRLMDDEAFADVATGMVAEARGRLCFEITETAVIEHPEQALAVIDRFAAAGIDISIDDYGTGLSSLAYLKRIRANELKIDKSFVFSMVESQRDALLVRSTIDLAHGLGLKVTAEGVETPTALALLRGMGCDIAQGYLIARPMPLGALLDFLAEGAPAERAWA